MKQRLCWYACDVDVCDEESPHEVSFERARRSARAAGWQFRQEVVRTWMGEPQRHEEHFCPEHKQ